MQERLEFDRMYLPPHVSWLLKEAVNHMANAGMDVGHLKDQIPNLRLYLPYQYDDFYFTGDRLKIPGNVYRVKMSDLSTLPPEYARWGEHYLVLYTDEGKIMEMKID